MKQFVKSAVKSNTGKAEELLKDPTVNTQPIKNTGVNFIVFA